MGRGCYTESCLELKFPKYFVPKLDKVNPIFRVRILDNGTGLDYPSGAPFISNDSNKRFIVTCTQLQAAKDGHDFNATLEKGNASISREQRA